MVRTFLKVYMELGSYFLFLQEQIKDIIIITCHQCVRQALCTATETEDQEQTPCAGTSKSDRNLADTVTIAIGGAKHILNTQVLPSAGNQAYTHIRHAAPR